MKKNLLHLMLLFVLLTPSLSLSPAAANLPTQPTSPTLPTGGGNELRADGLMRPDAQSDPAPAEQTTGATLDLQGPDAFGYTWDYTDYAWVDTSSGSDTGISSDLVFAGPFNIGFDFPYYQNSYRQLYISRNGFISFNDSDLAIRQADIPDPSLPNDLIAPQWGPYDMVNYVHYQIDGSHHDRRMVIEWHEVADYYSTDVYTFEVILHENGDIVFQYHSAINDGSWSCTSSGIENMDGLDGLTLREMCSSFYPGQAARIYRPAPSARVTLLPAEQSGFAHADMILQYPLTVRNDGDLGSDLFNLTVDSDWAVDIFASDGVTPLDDTDGDGIIDTGALSQAASLALIVRLTPPEEAVPGVGTTTIITATSSLDPMVSRNSLISLAFPAAFAQAYYASDSGTGIALIHPDYEIENLSAGQFVQQGLVEMANGNFMYVFEKYRFDSQLYILISELHTVVFNNVGEVLYPASLLSDLPPSIYNLWEQQPALAAAPNGETGILWVREELQSDLGISIQNLVFAIVDETGQPVYGPQVVTNNTATGSCYMDDDIPCYFSPRLAVTEDGTYAVSYQQMISESDVTYYDIFFGTRHADGSEQTPLVNLTRGVTGPDNYFPSLTSLAGNQFFLAWNSSTVSYLVFDSAGVLVQPLITLDTSLRYIDGIQLTDGSIFLAGVDKISDDGSQVYYLILDPTTYAILIPKTPLPYPYASGFITGFSVTRDHQAHAILTWAYFEGTRLVYALIGSDGQVVTPPLAFRNDPNSMLAVNSLGYANTTYSIHGSPIFQLFLPFIIR